MIHCARARESNKPRAAVMARLSRAHASELQRQALLRWMQAEVKDAGASPPRPEQTLACVYGRRAWRNKPWPLYGTRRSAFCFTLAGSTCAIVFA